MTKRLWEKGEGLDERVLAFTVGTDPALDLHIVRWDAVASAAHARMLAEVGLLERKECGELLRLLAEIHQLGSEFTIPVALEDCHTAIENYLVEHAGEAGKKIHTGRSRNDQVLAAMRLYLREQGVSLLRGLSECAVALIQRFDEVGDVPMPGYTHMQPAMPSSVGMWLHAHLEAVVELTRDGLTVLETLNASPLGTAAGFGTSLPLDREMTGRLLGFSRVQRSPIDVQNSRGRAELKFCRWLSDIGGVFEKLASDVIIYSMKEFGYFSLPASLTTGSSIMPQKHNPDVVELIRGKAAKIRGAEAELAGVVAKLPSNYHRDLGYTKEPVMRALGETSSVLGIVPAVIAGLVVNEAALERAMYDELYATYDVYRRVKSGVPFREAYLQTAEAVAQGDVDKDALGKDFALIAGSTREGVRAASAELEALRKSTSEWSELVQGVQRGVFEWTAG